MRILPLLNKSLKDKAILEILEWGDGYVIYDFDRSHENLPDVYYAHCKKRGMCMLFNEKQKLGTIFLYVLGIEGYTPLDLADVDDITFFSRFSDVEAYAKGKALTYKTGAVPEKCLLEQRRQRNPRAIAQVRCSRAKGHCRGGRTEFPARPHHDHAAAAQNGAT